MRAPGPGAGGGLGLLLLVLIGGCSSPPNHGLPSPTASGPITTTTSATPLPQATPSPASIRPLGAFAAASQLVEAGDGIRLPPGFRWQPWAAGLSHPTAMAVGPDGAIYVAEDAGEVMRVPRAAGQAQPYLSGLPTVLGLAWQGEQLYISAQGQLLRSDWSSNGPAPPRVVVGDIPTGIHQNDNVVVGRDGALYLGNGSTCNACAESDPRSATVLRWTPQSGLQVVATGARNPFGLIVAPWGDIFVSINGRDDLGRDQPPDLVEWLQPGADYGWPRCSYPVGDCAGVTPAVATLQAHSSADGMAFLHSQVWPPSFRDNLVIAEWGANDGDPGIGKRLERIQLRWTGNGWQSRVEPFLEGLPHPLALLELAGGSLLVADWERGVIVQVTPGG